ncbi:related to MFS alpha-glucoside transporter [Phialocephala subalpina]|uniref:Related to MFS alpha-glucoside transporter n=1 Tax=Phialocephala subalpina TaxID=576137 RepID=A0A1L7XTG0_9HELO|nr:related to MFS alpha-glucoside transporter [Phialocephala subalpina]
MPLASKPTGLGFSELWKHKRILGWCLMIFILPINFGYEAASTGNLLAIPTFLLRFGTPLPNGLREISTYDQQVLNAAFTCGLFAASLTAGFASDIIGRKRTIVLASTICVAGIFIQGFSTSIMMLFGGKFVSTFGFGLGHTLAPVYVAEIAPDSIRGVCLALVNGMIVIGQWLCALVGYGTSHIQNDWAWRALLLTQLAPPGLMLIFGVFLLPESPSWLIIKGRREQAAHSLLKFNGPNFNIENQITMLETAIEKEKAEEKENVSYLDCFKGSNLRRTTIVCIIFLAQQVSGVGFITGYLPYYFTIAGVKNPIGIVQISYAVQLLGNIGSWSVVDRVGRRPLVVYGMIIITATLLVIGGVGTIQNDKAAIRATVALMTIWGFLYQFTLGATAYAVGGETPAVRVRQKTYAINLMFTTLSATLVSQVIPILINPSSANLGAKIAFVFFAPSLIICIYLYFCFPEMKGRSYLELEEMFQKRIPARQFKNYISDAHVDSLHIDEKEVSVVHDNGTV